LLPFFARSTARAFPTEPVAPKIAYFIGDSFPCGVGL
jgi:hypothetical protein